MMDSVWLRYLVTSLLVTASSGASALAADRAAKTTARSGIDPSGFDKAVRPQDDFFRYVNGGWIARFEIPADRAIFGSFVEFLDKSEADLRTVIEEAAAKTDAAPGSDSRKIGDLFASFMDEDRANRLGIKP